MEKKAYLVGVTILEAREIRSKDAGMPDPFIRITCGNMEPQVTRVHLQTKSAVWNQSFTFNDLLMN